MGLDLKLRRCLRHNSIEDAAHSGDDTGSKVEVYRGILPAAKFC
jgi:hypothetical protein